VTGVERVREKFWLDNFACCFVWVRNLVAYVEGGT
jgi:hypothetical protein